MLWDLGFVEAGSLRDCSIFEIFEISMEVFVCC